MIDAEHSIVRRHRNKWGIAARVPTFVMMARALWGHRWRPVTAGLLVETSLWTLMPEVDAVPGAIENAIDVELRWLNAPASGAKRCSFAALALFAVLVPRGLWKHSPRTLGVAGASLLIFQALMHHVAARHPS